MKYDDELIQIFIEEAHDILDAVNNYFEQWRSSHSQSKFLEIILRELHTLKGSARMIGLAPISEYVHCLEQIIQKLHTNELIVNEHILKEIQHAIDYLNFYIEALSKSDLPEDEDIPVTQLKLCLHPFNDYMQSQEEQSQETDNLSLDFSSMNKNEQPSSEIVRIKSDMLEKFSKLAGQINITRSHMEQQLSVAHESLADMAKEVKLIQEQMRYLQVKADTNLRMYQTVLNEKSYEEFDILEFDRYSFLQQSTRLLVDKLNFLEELNNSVMNSMRSFEGHLVEQGRSARSLEEGITHARLISIDSIIPRLKRVVRQVSHELGKEVRLECIKAQGEVDRKILERLTPGLEHMVRNAVDHGIEAPQIRKLMNKPEYGIITLSMYRQGNEIVIELGDDGQGIDVDKVREKAIKKKLWDPRLSMTKADLIQIISLPGFSMKDVVTPISGRGVGLDVMNAQVNKLGGVLRLDTQKEVGSHFTIRLPFSLSLNQALIFLVNEQLYSIPLAHLRGITRMKVAEINEKFKTNNIIEYANESFELCYLGDLLLERKWEANDVGTDILPVIFLQSDFERVAFVIDKLIGSREIVIKPLGTQLQYVKEISGVSVLGDGQIVLVLHAQYLIQCAQAKLFRQKPLEVKPTNPLNIEKQANTVVLIVDDSMTVRQVTSRLLKRHFYKPLTAKDGMEAFEVMAHTVPNIVLLDIEMPRMDGFQVVEKMRSLPEYKNIPVIMITSRSGEKHRLRAMSVGANAYLSKPYLEEDLLELLREYEHHDNR